ncbi:unnamed protein product [Leuciscus chuanchicus]
MSPSTSRCSSTLCRQIIKSLFLQMTPRSRSDLYLSAESAIHIPGSWFPHAGGLTVDHEAIMSPFPQAKLLMNYSILKGARDLQHEPSTCKLSNKPGRGGSGMCRVVLEETVDD